MKTISLSNIQKFFGMLFFSIFLQCCCFMNLQAQEEVKSIAEILTEKGIDEQIAFVFDADFTIIKNLSKKVLDSTANYEELRQVVSAYELMISVANLNKIKPAVIIEAYPPAKQLLMVANKARLRLKTLEEKDVRVKFRVESKRLEDEMHVAKIGDDSNVVEMLKILSFTEEKLIKQNPLHLSYLTDLHVVTKDLILICDQLEDDMKAKIQVKPDFASAVDRIKNSDLHHDEEFKKIFTHTKVVEKLIEVGLIAVQVAKLK